MKLEWKTCFKVGISIFLLYLCIYYWSSVSMFFDALINATVPLIIGAAVAYIINIMLNFYERHFFSKAKSSFILQIRRPLCITFSFITVITLVTLIIGLILPQIISAISLILKELPDAINTIIDMLDSSHFVSKNIITQLQSINWSSIVNQFFDVVTNGIGNIMNIVVNTVSSVFSAVINTVLSIMFAIYLLVSKDKLAVQVSRIMKNYLPLFWREKASYTIKILNKCFHKYIVGQCIEAVILGALCTLGMLILRLPYATMIGPLIAFTALIPIAGAYIGAAIGALMILTVSPTQSLVFLIFLLILQQIEGNIIYPRVVGSSVGLPGIWVLAAVTVFGGIMGIFGMMIGVPLTATLYLLIKEDVLKRESAADNITK